MKNLLLSALLFSILIPFAIFEGIRFRRLYRACLETHQENELLLSGTDCNAWERQTFAKKDAMCREAEAEQKMEPVVCAWHHLWEQGEPLRVWKMYTESYWMLWGITVVVAAVFIFAWFASRNHQKTLDAQERMLRETLSVMKKSTPMHQIAYDDDDDDVIRLLPGRPGEPMRRLEKRR